MRRGRNPSSEIAEESFLAHQELEIERSSTLKTPEEVAREVVAARQMDWKQVVLNGGPPCFHLDSHHFCGRAERWPGHGELHKFVSLSDLLTDALRQASQRAECPHESASFNAEHDNYYCDACNKGMGEAFYDAAKQAESASSDVEKLLKVGKLLTAQLADVTKELNELLESSINALADMTAQREAELVRGYNVKSAYVRMAGERDAAQALLREAGKALEPFADWTTGPDFHDEPDHRIELSGFSHKLDRAVVITVVHFRQAAALLAKIREGK